MKLPRYVSLFLAVLTAISLAATACSNNDGETTSDTTATALTAATVPDTTSTASPPPTTTEPPPATTTPDPPTSTTTPPPAATTPETPQPSASGTDINLAYLFPLTGDLAPLVTGLIKGVELAVREINLVGIQTIQLFPGDTATDPEVAQNTLTELIANDVQGIVGTFASTIALSLIERLKDTQIPMISPSNTAPALSNYDDGGYYFRTSVTDALQGQVLGDLIANDGGQDVVILFHPDEYGQGLATVAQNRLEANGVNIATFIPLALDPDGAAFQGQLQAIKESGADSMIFIPFDGGARYLAQMIAAATGPQDISIYIPDGLASDDLWMSVNPNDPSSVEGIKGTRPAPNPSAEATFPDRFAEYAPGLDLGFAPHAYDAAVILALAALIAGSNDPADYVAEVNGVTRGGAKCERYEECAQLVLEGEDIDYDGASGPLEFTEIGEPSQGSYDIIEYNSQGQLEVIDSVTLSTDG